MLALSLAGSILLVAANPGSFAHDMLAAHNAVRSRAGVPRLVWSERLAKAAGQWGDMLVRRNQFAHNPKTPYGENIFEIVGAPASPAEIVSDWGSEEQDYNYGANSCRAVCGHYTQIVWRNTREVGCAIVHRGNREICVCEYDPPGNFIGQRPY